ncbi:hypothetical protein CCACVL1_00346, partial [Corchorus capsularis]
GKKPSRLEAEQNRIKGSQQNKDRKVEPQKKQQ